MLRLVACESTLVSVQDPGRADVDRVFSPLLKTPETLCPPGRKTPSALWLAISL